MAQCGRHRRHVGNASVGPDDARDPAHGRSSGRLSSAAVARGWREGTSDRGRADAQEEWEAHRSASAPRQERRARKPISRTRGLCTALFRRSRESRCGPCKPAARSGLESTHAPSRSRRSFRSVAADRDCSSRLRRTLRDRPGPGADGVRSRAHPGRCGSQSGAYWKPGFTLSLGP
jgi:hypothetical protein